ncbi:isochorismate synthase [Microbacterium sp. CJ88]|uniref:isochorismate synthase n=1 Tax=Microbacterium sp. CJ88 TaxID=3445672 RepID=UPI003F65FAB4
MSLRPAHTSPPRLRAVTREVDAIEDVLAYTPGYDPLFWSRRGDAMAAFGTVLSWGAMLSPVAPGMPVGQIADTWRTLAEAASVDDPVGLPGTGLVGFGSFAFDPRSDRENAFVIPDTIVGRRGGRSWVTRIGYVDAEGLEPELPTRMPFGPHWSATLGPGAMTPEGYMAAVAAAVASIRRGELDKVVLARDLVGTIPAGADLRRLVRELVTGYPDCWTFAVDGLIGASPETLVSVSHGTVTARVLAGTIARGADADADAAASLALATSAKDQEEHRFAVRSLLDTLRPHTSALAAAEQPFTLKLPNVWHLATDVEGTLGDASSALDLVRALHPTAAVGGTPTDAAIEAIHESEPFDRGRYAGAVGWIDGSGDGEWAIALRCAQFGPARPGAATVPVAAYAGAGVVADSDPESELLETRVKFRPIVDALA